MTSSEDEGYLASVVTHESGYGSEDCPWLIKTLPGQRVQLRLLDFTYRVAQNDLHPNPQAAPDSASSSSSVAKQRLMTSPVCQRYADVTEPGLVHVICGTNQRDAHTFTSKGEEVTVKVERHLVPKRAGVFLIHYEGIQYIWLPLSDMICMIDCSLFAITRAISKQS
jgi:hypothetical protein